MIPEAEYKKTQNTIFKDLSSRDNWRGFGISLIESLQMSLSRIRFRSREPTERSVVKTLGFLL